MADRNDGRGVSIADLRKVYRSSSFFRTSPGVVALDGVNLEIKDGSFLGLIGVNGSGKSTLINILSGTVTKDSGSVTVCGYDLDSQRQDVSRMLGVVPQEVIFDPFFTAKEVLLNYMGYYGLSKDVDKVEHLLRVLGLHEKINVCTRSLSGGMRRRLLVAKALITDPRIVILDEPTAGIDVEQRQVFWEYIRYLNREKGMTIILTTHHIEEVEALCDTVAVLYRGKISKVDKTQNILNQYRKVTYLIECSASKLALEVCTRLKGELERQNLQSAAAGKVFLEGTTLSLEGVTQSDFVYTLMQLERCKVMIENIKTQETNLEEIFKQIIAPS